MDFLLNYVQHLCSKESSSFSSKQNKLCFYSHRVRQMKNWLLYTCVGNYTAGRMHNISKSKLAATRAVLPVVSYAGATSTKSAPIMFNPLQPRMISSP